LGKTPKKKNPGLGSKTEGAKNEIKVQMHLPLDLKKVGLQATKPTSKTTAQNSQLRRGTGGYVVASHQGNPIINVAKNGGRPGFNEAKRKI